MSKELEALERITEHLDLDDAYFYTKEKEDEEIIKQALTELQAIKEAKPNEAMERLQNLRLYQCGACEHHHCLKCDVYKNFNAVNQYILKAEKLEKAWEVVREKNVDVALIRLCKDSGEYNGEITLQDEWWHRKLLTQEEFDLLKEMLE